MSESPLPLSVLDLALVADGQTTAEALADTVAVAQAAERLGCRRIWVAEHHNMETVASTSPPVLIAHLASVTSTIRVGSGGVMLPNHAPLVVAEQFALLEALHPGRIDLGIGRAPGTDRATAVVFRRGPGNRDDEEFPPQPDRPDGPPRRPSNNQGLWDHFRATPAATSSPDVFLLGSSGFSAQLAGMLGLPFAFAHHFDMGGTIEAAGIYRDHFEPSTVLAEPRLLVTASALAADTDAEAQRLSAPNRLRRLGLRTGRLLPLMSPAEALAHPSYPQARDMDTAALVGTAETVCDGLRDLAERTQASEIMLFTSTHQLVDRLHSFELVANQWGLRT